MAERNQAGMAVDYVEWVPESTRGTVPTDPAWNAYSDNVRTAFDGSPDASTEAQRGLGERDPVGFFNGPEEHEFGFTYDLQQWYVDGAGATVDAGGAIMQDTPDNGVPESHTVVQKEAHAEGGSDGGGRYVFTVGVGGVPATLTVPFETEDGLPIQQELSYRFEKVREYDVSQPSASVPLGVQSTSTEDTTQSITLENDDGTTSETLTLNGTSFVATTASFASLAGAYLDAETQGTIQIGTSDEQATPAMAQQLSEIQGIVAYGDVEGDRGVPVTGAGSHAGAIGTAYIRFNEDQLHYSGPTDIAPEIVSGELEIDAGVDATTQNQSVRQTIDVAGRTTTLTASLVGPKVSVDQMVDYLTSNQQDIEWVANSGGTLSIDQAHITSVGDLTRETDNAKLVSENEWQSEGVTVTA